MKNSSAPEDRTRKWKCPLLSYEIIDEDNCFENCLIAEGDLNSEFYPKIDLPKDKAKEICLSCEFHEDDYYEEYIYAKIQFNKTGRTFYYTTGRVDLKVGDKVIVPFGSYDTERVGFIVEVETFREDEVPFDYYRTKCIYRKAEEKKTLSRKFFSDIELFGEEEAYQIIRTEVENGNYDFNFDMYYDRRLSIDEEVPYKVGKNRADVDKFYEQCKKILKNCESKFNELDEHKPLYAENSLGEHYVNELFFEQPKTFICYGDPFVWASLSRKFSYVPLPECKEEISSLFWDAVNDYNFPESEFIAFEIEEFTYRKSDRKVSLCSLKNMLKQLIKNYEKISNSLKELI